MSRIFLLSPANTDGLRAKQLTSPRAQFEAARLYRTEQGVPIALAFAFMSALYFRGKIAYALRFAAPPESLGGHGIYVITPGFGLVPPDWCINEERMNVMRKIDVDSRVAKYRKPLERDAKEIAAKLDRDTEVVLLGSVATGKYVDILWPIFGERLRFPSAFAGLGDMARGGLMLRAVRADRELDYVSLDTPRHRPPGADGKMPKW